MSGFNDLDREDYENEFGQSIPRADQGAYNFTPSESATTEYTHSMAGKSFDSQSRMTSYTYSSNSDAQRFVKRVDNRTFNVLSEGYFLPTDDDEWARLDKQHVALTVALGGLYPEKETVRVILAPEDGVTKKILDLGCGTGVWTTEIAAEFPHVRVIGVDVAPVPIEAESLPSNVRFELDDINLGIEHFKDFDVVHARLVASGLHDFRKSMKDVHSCLKPGGIALWLDVDYDIYSFDQEVYLPFASDDNPEGSWTQRIFNEVYRAAVKSGKSDLVGAAEALDAGLWDDPLMDPETCRAASLYLPIGPWASGNTIHEDQQLKYVGALMRQDLMSTQRAVTVLLKKIGWPEDVVNEWSRKADEEMMGNKMPMWGRMKLAWGRRRAAPGEPAPPLPVTSSTPATEQENLDDAGPYPEFYIYKTREESLQAAQRRNSSKAYTFPPGPPGQATQTQ